MSTINEYIGKTKIAIHPSIFPVLMRKFFGKFSKGTLLEMLRLHPNIVAPGYYKTENTFYAEDQLYEKGD